MTHEHDFIGQLEGYLDEFEGFTPLPDATRDAVRREIPSIRQRSAWWPGWRLPTMNATMKFGLAAAVLAVAALLSYSWFVAPNVGGPRLFGPTPTLAPSPIALPGVGALEAATYFMTPFASPNERGLCTGQAQCTESSTDDSITVTFTAPEGWGVSALGGIWVNADRPPDGAMLSFWRGGWVYDDPCRQDGLSPTIEVGPTVDDFVDALANHSALDVTGPVDVTLAGYAGKYVDIQSPSTTGQCTQQYRIWEPNVYAQGPEYRFHLWVLDVAGERVVVETTDFASTPTEIQDELARMLDSLQITP